MHCPRCRAELTERDAIIFQENDIEVFIDGGDCYYEFEMNALGTIYEVFFIWKDAFRRGGRFDVRAEPFAEALSTGEPVVADRPLVVDLRQQGLCLGARQRRHAEERLRQAAKVFDSTAEGVMVTDAENRIVAVNNTFTTPLACRPFEHGADMANVESTGRRQGDIAYRIVR